MHRKIAFYLLSQVINLSKVNALTNNMKFIEVIQIILLVLDMQHYKYYQIVIKIHPVNVLMSLEHIILNQRCQTICLQDRKISKLKILKFFS
jgi:hypothetical protein